MMLLRCCIPIICIFAFLPASKAQAPCTDFCTTPIPCYNLTIPTSNGSATASISGSGSCCPGIPANQNCAQVTLNVPAGTSGVQLTFNGPNQCSIDLFNITGMTGCTQLPAAQSICSVVCSPPVNGQIKLLLCKPGNFNAISITFTAIPVVNLMVTDVTENCSTTFNVSGGGSISFSSVANPTLSYLNCGSGPGVNITCNNPTFIYTGPPVTNCNGILIDYTVTVTGNACNANASVTKSVRVYPAISGNLVVSCSGNTATLTFTPTISCPDLTYQFLDPNGNPIAGATTNTLTIPADNMQYCIVVSRSATPVCTPFTTCATATCCMLNVTCPPANGGTFQCISQIPPGMASDVMVNSSCGTATVTITNTSTGTGCPNSPYVLTRKYTVTDANSNMQVCTVTYTVIDNTPPTITCPAPVTVQCASQVPAANTGSVTTADNCGGTVTVTFVGDVITNQTCANRYTITRTYRATDPCGNSATCAQVITVFDNTAPTITCPAPVTVQCASLVPAASNTAATASDNCGGAVTVTFSPDVITNQTCANRYTITRVYTATDLCGNTATCAQVITVFDNTPPTFINVPANVTAECVIVPPVPPLPVAADNCNGAVTVVYLGQTQVAGVCPIIYTLTRMWRATDACGNSTTATQVITVIDTYAPQFTTDPVDVVLECDITTNMATFQQWLNNHGGAVVFDCSPVTWTYMDSPFHTCPSTCAGTFQKYIRFIATDQCGNSSFRDASFIVVDLTPPTFTTLPQNLEVECMPDCDGEAQLMEWVEHFGNAVVTDNCGGVTTDLLFVSEKQGCGNTYTRVYQFRATDECGNTNYVTATFAVVDHTAPVIVKCPEGNATMDCALNVPGPDLAGVIATDNCGSVHISATTFTTGSGCAYSPMTVSYWYMATDECGNMTSNCDQSFQVTDLTPAIYTGPDTLYVGCVDDLPGLEDLTAVLLPYMDDNCVDIICIGNIVAQNGTNSITYSVSAKDFCNNASPKFTVTFIATGSCKPICSASQAVWGSQDSLINGTTTAQAINLFIGQHGSITAGKGGKTVNVTGLNCLYSMLPTTTGITNQFDPGNNEFGAANGCNPTSTLLNGNGTLKNELAANVLTLQLNIWYNQEFNNRNLGMRHLSELSDCAIDAVILAKLQSMNIQATVQGLLNLSNNYLAGIGFYPANFGDLMNEALTNLNGYWNKCEIHDPCSNKPREDARIAEKLSNLSLAPNPVLDVVTISLEVGIATELQVRFIGSSGLQSEEKVSVVKGFNTLSFSTKNFPAGVYTVVLQDGKDLQTLRMVKMKD